MTTTRLLRNARVREEVVEDTLFLIDEAADAIYHLDPLGAALWRLLEAEPGLDEVVALFAEAFPAVEPMTLAADVLAAIETLCAAGLAVPSITTDAR